MLVLVLCVGLVLGGLGWRAWNRHQQAGRPRFAAAVYPTTTSGQLVPVELRLRNLGTRTTLPAGKSAD